MMVDNRSHFGMSITPIMRTIERMQLEKEKKVVQVEIAEDWRHRCDRVLAIGWPVICHS